MKAFLAYMREVHRKTGYFASWFPSEPMALGDVGTLTKGERFNRVTSLQNLGVSFESVAGPTLSVLECVSSGASVTCLDATGAATPTSGLHDLKGTARVKFEGAYGVLFRAVKCRATQIADKHSLAARVGELRHTNAWDRGWHIVSEVVEAGGLTVVVSDEEDASLDLSASATAAFDIADSSLGLQWQREEKVAVKLLAHAATTPLYRLVRTRLFGAGLRELGVGPSDNSSDQQVCEIVDLDYDDLPD